MPAMWGFLLAGRRSLAGRWRVDSPQGEKPRSGDSRPRRAPNRDGVEERENKIKKNEKRSPMMFGQVVVVGGMSGFSSGRRKSCRSGQPRQASSVGLLYS